MTEFVTHVEARDVELPRGAGTALLLVLDNGSDGARPATLGGAGLTELRERLTEARERAARGEIVAVVVTGVGGCFCAGADLQVVASLRTRAEAREVAELGHATLRMLGELEVPSFALLNGYAFGGGLEIALHCTFRAAADDVRRLALPEAHLGLVAGWGGTYLAPRLLGIERGIELALERPLANNRPTDARTALEWGLVDALLSRESFLDAGLDWVSRVLADEATPHRRPLDDAATWRTAVDVARERLDARLRGARKAPYRTLELLAAARDNDRDTHFAAEDDALEEFLVSDGLHAALYAFELTTRAARRPSGDPGPEAAREVGAVGIVGAGLMATQLAVLLASRLGVPVVLRDLDDERVAAGRAAIEAQVDQLRARGRVSDDEAARILGSCTVTTELAELARADLVIEAVTEVLAVKKSVLAELEQIVPAETILATNTSALSVTAMGEHLADPSRVVGLHFFNPVAAMPLVEVVRTPATSPAALATAFALARALGKTAVGVADRPGFVVNRLLLRMLADVAATVEEGTSVEVADRALDPLGLPMRPFRLLDLVGLSVALHVLETLHSELGDRFPLSPGLAALRDEGARLADRDGAVDPAIQRAFPGGGPGLDEQGVRTRVLEGLAEEVGAMLDERVVDDVREIDVCMILGAGWPIANGGIAPLLDREGVSERVLGRRLLPDGVANVARQ